MFRTYNYRALFYVLAFLIPVLTFSQEQTTEAKKLFVEAESYFLFEEYKDALPLYQRISQAEPTNYNVIYKIGMCYLNDIYQKQKSIKYLEKAVQNINPTYKQNSFKEKQAPPEAHYYLGKAYHENAMLDQAIESYQCFRKLASPEEYNLGIVDEDIASCQLAKKLITDPIFLSLKNLGSPIDTRFEEINPVLSGDGKSLAFTRKLQFYDGVFLSVKDEKGFWSEPVNLTSFFGLDGSSFTTGISFSGDEIFVYRSDNFDGNIYSSKKKNDQWSSLVKLNDNINTKYWESHASSSPDGRYLIFTSNREGGYGGLDIYKSKRGSNGEWGPAVNMGPVLNSPSNEETPFLSNDGYTMFFSSEGHKTMGGYDVFISNLQSDGTWSKPKNMGYPINTTDDNTFYSPTGENAFGLYSLYREEDTEGLLDIYSVEVYNEMIPRVFTLNGNVKASDGNTGVYKNLKAKLYDAKSKELILEKEIAEDGSFSMQPSQGNYLLTIEGPGIETYQKSITLAVNQSESLVDLPAITVLTAEVATEPFVATIPAKSKIATKKEYYTVNSDEAVPIELLLPKGANLHVEIDVNDSLTATKDISDVKRKFTYFYTPQPGENRLHFTATDPDSNISSIDVVVTYYPVPAPSLAEKKVESDIGPAVNTGMLAIISSGALSEYLKKMDASEYTDYVELYQHLLEIAEKEGFTQEEIQQMYSIFFTQKDVKTFSRKLTEEAAINDSLWKQYADSSKIPLEYLDKLLKSKQISNAKLSELLLSLLMKEGISGEQLFSNLVDFSGSGAIHGESETEGISVQQAWELFAGEQDDRKAGNTLQITATTDDFDFFFQNLLLSSDSSLHDYLVRLQPEPLGITTSIGLVGFLFNSASDTTYSSGKLIQALQKGSMNRYYYLDRFTELLASGATGSLKSELLLSARGKRSYSTFAGLLEYLLNQAKYKNYTRESVYDLILGLIGIDNVEEFASKIRSYGYSEINKALGDTTLTYFSSPMELIQYLLMATQTYDFTETDINNLLIRMILEKGLHDRSRSIVDDAEQKFWKSKRFVPTVILVNIVLLILIILFRIRKKGQN